MVAYMLLIGLFWKLEFVWKYKSCLDLQIKITPRLLLL